MRRPSVVAGITSLRPRPCRPAARSFVQSLQLYLSGLARRRRGLADRGAARVAVARRLTDGHAVVVLVRLVRSIALTPLVGN